MALRNSVKTYYPRQEMLSARGRQDIHSTLGRLGLGKYNLGPARFHYFVIGGANLVLRGIRETTGDIDMLVSSSLLRTLSLQEGAEIHEPPASAKNRGATNTSVWINHEGLAMPVSATDELGDGYYPLAYGTHRNEIELVDDIPCLRLPHVVASKVALGRPKDIVDIELIAAHLRSQA